LEDKMSQYRWMRSLVAVSTLGAVAATGCFVVDDEPDNDDEDNGGEDSGGSAGKGGKGGSSSGGKGGSAGSVSTGGAGPAGGSGGSGGECVEAGGICEVPTDCCAVQTGTGFCVGGACADACTVDSECDTNCCAELTNGSFACGPAELCEEPPMGDAVMKFCNELFLGGTEVVALTVVFAGVEATAMSGECTPVVPNACIPIPSGTDPSVVLMDDLGEIIVSGSFPTLTVAAGEEILVDATVDDMGTPTDTTDDYPTVLAGPFNAGLVCADTDPLPPDMLETRSAPYRLPFAQDARHALKRSVTREARAALPAYRFGTK
jgi:hypothetical protein